MAYRKYLGESGAHEIINLINRERRKSRYQLWHDTIYDNMWRYLKGAVGNFYFIYTTMQPMADNPNSSTEFRTAVQDFINKLNTPASEEECKAAFETVCSTPTNGLGVCIRDFNIHDDITFMIFMMGLTGNLPSEITAGDVSEKFNA